MEKNILNFKKFEIIDERDQLQGVFETPEEVENFFDDIDERITENYSVEAFDENDLIVGTWYMPDVINGNFKDDVEKQKRQNKTNQI